jgi:hypothetical protein
MGGGGDLGDAGLNRPGLAQAEWTWACRKQTRLQNQGICSFFFVSLSLFFATWTKTKGLQLPLALRHRAILGFAMENSPDPFRPRNKHLYPINPQLLNWRDWKRLKEDGLWLLVDSFTSSFAWRLHTDDCHGGLVFWRAVCIFIA